jgi:hypothetical protein
MEQTNFPQLMHGSWQKLAKISYHIAMITDYRCEDKKVGKLRGDIDAIR